MKKEAKKTILSEASFEEVLQFLIDNELDEIISEKEVNHFQFGENSKDFLKKISQEKSKKVENNLPITSSQNSNKETANSHEFSDKNIKNNFSNKEKEENSNPFINPVFSTSHAISGLAKKMQNMSAKKSNLDLEISINKIVKEAKNIAAKCSNLKELKEAVENFDGCNLKKMATNTVFADGNENSKIVVIGEAPGNHEDLQGIPFCGDSGKVLDAMFKAINLTRKENLYITNVIFWRPPGNRRPTEEELKICRPFVERHLQLLNPQVIVLVGATSMAAILDSQQTISSIRGKFMPFKPDYLDKEIKAFTIFHPSFLMRQPAKKKLAWKDMLEIERFLQDSK
jgi:DNA polymerase